MAISPYISNIIIILGMMQVAKHVLADDPLVLNTIRGGYILSNVIITSLYARVYVYIKQKNDLTTLSHVEPGSNSPSKSKPVTTSVYLHDLKQLRNALRSQFLIIAAACFIHFYLGFKKPMLTQSIIPLKGAFENKLVQIHIFGRPASGDLARPFKTPRSFLSMIKGDSP